MWIGYLMRLALKDGHTSCLSGLLLTATQPIAAQQKGQWVPGQYGLNAGVIPSPGFTYMNMAVNYSADQLNNSNGNQLPGVTGTYPFWSDENIFVFVPKHKSLGGYCAPYVSVNVANGSLVADIVGTNLSGNGGGAGLADTFVEPFNLCWHFSRLECRVRLHDTPTERHTPGASNNVGSGYWSQNINSGATFYITRNKPTSATIFGLGGSRFETDHHGRACDSGSGVHDGVGIRSGTAARQG